VPLHKAGKFTAAMAVHQTRVRHWTRDEIDLVQLVVARCWESLERARTIRSLQNSEQRFRFMAESMPQKFFTAKASGAIDYMNPQWAEFTGLPQEKIVGPRWEQFIHPDDLAENTRCWNHSLATGEPLELEHRFRRHDGVYLWHLTRAQAMRDPFGEVSMWIGSNTLIEDQKQAEEKLERIVAERTVKLRDTIGELESFSYSIAHDLRAPLRSLQGFSDILLSEHAEHLDSEGQGFLRRIATAAGRMDKLIQDVLNYSRIVRGESPLERVPVEPLLRSIVETYPMFSPDKADIIVEGEFPIVLGNEAMLTQIFSNLLGNAVKFVAKGLKPQVRVWAEPHAPHVQIFVQDNGIGIPADQHEKIFAIFQQADLGYGGTGIGLAIVKKAVERMGGQVGVTSRRGEGSTFWIDLPRA
jgi:PAS domain S-box-containing protein